MSKRKGTDYDCAAAIPSSSTVSVSYNDTHETWTETRQKLKELRSFSSADDLLSSIETCLSLQGDLDTELSNAALFSQNIKRELGGRIEMAREACKEESHDVYQQQLLLEQARADKRALQDALEELDGIQAEIKERIHMCQEMASVQMESIDKVEADRMRQVPRLKQQISLYATTTGIKWDFGQEHVLAGQVVRAYIYNC
jgi:uncharacterized membrane protein YccC